MKIRENILHLSSYKTARDEYSGEIGCYLDANENPFNNGFNRYPDPHQKKIKEQMARIKNINTDQIFVGNGSDEAIDLIVRIFCSPGSDNIVSISPSYGMYRVAAEINDVEMREVKLDEDFQLNADKILAAADSATRVIFICSPNNPTGNSLKRAEIEKIITFFDGVVVIDEAYIDFAREEGFLSSLNSYPKLIILYTLSKAWGLAALRLGFAFASETIISYMDRVKYPYNIGADTQAIVLQKLLEEERVKSEVDIIIKERERVIRELSTCKIKVYPSDANFILVEVDLYKYLINNKIIVRDRMLQAGGLRITIGTPEENDKLIAIFKNL